MFRSPHRFARQFEEAIPQTGAPGDRGRRPHVQSRSARAGERRRARILSCPPAACEAMGAGRPSRRPTCPDWPRSRRSCRWPRKGRQAGSARLAPSRAPGSLRPARASRTAIMLGAVCPAPHGRASARSAAFFDFDGPIVDGYTASTLYEHRFRAGEPRGAVQLLSAEARGSVPGFVPMGCGSLG
jgi:hypothetical protein